MSSSSRVKIAVIGVDYHTPEVTLHLARDIRNQVVDADVSLLIVDNDGRIADGASSEARELTQLADVVWPGANLGYYPAAEWGRNWLERQGHQFDWVIVSNPDIRVPDPRFLQSLISKYSDRPPGVIAPRIVSGISGEDQNPFYLTRPSATTMRSYTVLFRWYPIAVAYTLAATLAKHLRSRRVKRPLTGDASMEPGTRPSSVYAVHGSFMAFSSAYFGAGGDLAHGAFLFHEEIFVAETCRRLGLSIIYDPSLTVLHAEHATTGWIKNRRITRHLWQASCYSYSEFFRNR